MRVLAAAVAAVCLLSACQAGVREPLRVTLSAAQVCEVYTPRESLIGRNVLDDEGNVLRTEDDSRGWWGGGETEVRWSVTGGAAPYTLEIDGLSRDGSGSYTGATGSASVSCAMSFPEPIIDEELEVRFYPNPPVVRSGTKTIRAVATDSAGVTGEASVRIHAVLSVELGDTTVMHGGLTYRLLGRLYTIPEGMSMALDGGYSMPMCLPDAKRCEPTAGVAALGPGYEAFFGLGTTSGTEQYRFLRLADPEDSYQPQGSSAVQTPSAAEINRKLDQFFASLGLLPTMEAE